MARVLVLSFSSLATDPRVDRQIAVLRSRYEVSAAGFAPPRHDVHEFIDISTPRRATLGRALGLARLIARRFEAAYWTHPTNVAVFRRLRPVTTDVIVANDLYALPLALRLGPPVVFDAHEYAPRQFADRWWWRMVISPYMSWQCRRYIPSVAAMTTVGPAIADEYERETGVRADVVINAPPRADLLPTAVHDPIRILHHGSAQRGRGLEEMVRVAELLDERFVVDFVLVEATPGYRGKLMRLAGGNPRLRFSPAQPMHLLPRMANDYDVGLYLLQPRNFNQRYALPNKLFEFIQGRLAVAVGPSPEMARVVREHGVGIVADGFSAESMAGALNSLDAATISAFKRASHVAADELCAERSEVLILNAVERALTHGAHHS